MIDYDNGDVFVVVDAGFADVVDVVDDVVAASCCCCRCCC